MARPGADAQARGSSSATAQQVLAHPLARGLSPGRGPRVTSRACRGGAFPRIAYARARHAAVHSAARRLPAVRGAVAADATAERGRRRLHSADDRQLHASQPVRHGDATAAAQRGGGEELSERLPAGQPRARVDARVVPRPRQAGQPAPRHARRPLAGRGRARLGHRRDRGRRDLLLPAVLRRLSARPLPALLAVR